MKKLCNQFKKNGLNYQLIKRNEEVALYGLSGTYTDDILHYEVCRIQIRNDKFGHRETIPSNERFGRDGSLAFTDKEQVLQYFYELSTRLKMDEKASNDSQSGKENLWGNITLAELLLATSGY